MTQETKILNFMLKGNSITPIDALRKFDCFRLAARISDLKKDNYPIIMKLVTKGKKTFASYSIIENYRPL